MSWTNIRNMIREMNSYVEQTRSIITYTCFCMAGSMAGSMAGRFF